MDRADESGLILEANFSDPQLYDNGEYLARRIRARRLGGGRIGAFQEPTRPGAVAVRASRHLAYEKVPFPTLAIAGGADKLREPGYHEVLRRIPGVRVEVLDGAGHLLNIERADEFNKLATEFLAGP